MKVVMSGVPIALSIQKAKRSKALEAIPTEYKKKMTRSAKTNT